MFKEFAQKTRFLLIGMTFLISHPSFSIDAYDKQGANDKHGTVSLRVEVTGGEPVEPVVNAEVYVRSDEPSHFDPLTCHTNRHGVAQPSNLPRTKVLIQVTKKGWRTFGHHYDLDAEGPVIKITLEKEPEPAK